MGRLPPVLRALPGAARRSWPIATSGCGRLLRADPDGVPLDLAPGSCRGGRGSTSGSCRTSISTPARSTATPATRTTASTASGVRIDRAAADRRSIGNLRATVAGLSLEAGRHGVVGLRRQHQLRRRGDGREGAPSSGELRGECTGAQPSGTSAPTPAATAGSRPRAGRAGPRLRHRPGRGRAQLPRSSAQEQRADILPLVLDLANPSPGIGWASGERRSLARARERRRRARPGPDPPPRHLAQRPAADAGGPVRGRSRAWAVVEFVPKEDPMVRRLLATRRGRLPGLHARRASGRRPPAGSTIVSERPIEESPRVLFLLRRRADAAAPTPAGAVSGAGSAAGR